MKQNIADAKRLKGNEQLMSCMWLLWGSFAFQTSTTMNKVFFPGFGFKRLQWNDGITITPTHYCIPQTKGLSALSSAAMAQTSDKTPENPKFLSVGLREKHWLQSGSKTSVNLLKKRKKGFYFPRYPVIPSWARKALMFWKLCLKKLHCCFWEAAPLQKVQTNMQVKSIRDNNEIQSAWFQLTLINTAQWLQWTSVKLSDDLLFSKGKIHSWRRLLLGRTSVGVSC